MWSAIIHPDHLRIASSAPDNAFYCTWKPECLPSVVVSSINTVGFIFLWVSSNINYYETMQYMTIQDIIMFHKTDIVAVFHGTNFLPISYLTVFICLQQLKIFHVAVHHKFRFWQNLTYKWTCVCKSISKELLLFWRSSTSLFDIFALLSWQGGEV